MGSTSEDSNFLGVLSVSTMSKKLLCCALRENSFVRGVTNTCKPMSSPFMNTRQIVNPAERVRKPAPMIASFVIFPERYSSEENIFARYSQMGQRPSFREPTQTR